MYVRKTYRKRTSTKPKRAYKKRAPKGVTLATKRYVKREIHRNLENKKENTLSTGNNIAAYNQNTSLFTISCIPYSAIGQSAADGDRIANVIKTRKCMMNLSITPADYNGTTNAVPKPQEVLLFFGKVKNAKPQQPIASDFAKLYQAGSTTSSPQSNLLDLLMPINKDWFTVYKVIKCKVGFAVNNNSGLNVAAAAYANNDYKLNYTRKINLTKYCPKTLIFNDGSNQPTNDGLWMWAMSVNADGSPINSPIPIKCTYSTDFEYEDA